MPQEKSAFDDAKFNKEELEKTLTNVSGCSDDPTKVVPGDCEGGGQSGGRELKNVGITEEEQKAYLASRPYTATKSILHKGKMPKPGHTFLKVSVKWKDREYTNVREFPTAGLYIDGKLNHGILNHLYDKLYEEIKTHHQSVVHGKTKK